MDSKRQNKISRLIQKELGEIFRGQIRTIVMGTMVSVTNVRISPDLSVAKVYLSIFPVENKTNVFDSIVSNASTIRFHLGAKTGKQLRIIPELAFFIDDSLDYIDNIDNILKNC